MSRQVEPAIAVHLARAVIHAAEFAREGRRLAGSLPIAALRRVAESLAGSAGELQCEVRGETGADGRDYLLVTARGRLELRCQRCLGAVSYDLDIDNRLLVLRPGTEVSDEELDSDEFDVLEAGKETAVLDLLEDEIVLALPISPRHADCGMPAAADKDARPSAFAGLARLKK